MKELPIYKKTPHVLVKYGKGDEKEHCGICKHFIAAQPPRCETVRSPIAANMWCERFERKG